MKGVHRLFLFSEESLQSYFFFRFFLVQFILKDKDLIFFSPTSLPSHLGNSAEFTEFHRFIPSSTRFIVGLVSDVGIDAVRAESVTNRPSRIRLGRFFEPC